MQMCLQLLKWQASIALTSMHRCLQSWYACLVVHAALFYDKCCLTNLCTFLQIWVLLIIASSELPFNRWARISTDYSQMGQAQLISKLTLTTADFWKICEIRMSLVQESSMYREPLEHIHCPINSIYMNWC